MTVDITAKKITAYRETTFAVLLVLGPRILLCYRGRLMTAGQEQSALNSEPAMPCMAPDKATSPVIDCCSF
jgi:hypothetical protein